MPCQYYLRVQSIDHRDFNILGLACYSSVLKDVRLHHFDTLFLIDVVSPTSSIITATSMAPYSSGASYCRCWTSTNLPREWRQKINEARSFFDRSDEIDDEQRLARAHTIRHTNATENEPAISEVSSHRARSRAVYS